MKKFLILIIGLMVVLPTASNALVSSIGAIAASNAAMAAAHSRHEREAQEVSKEVIPADGVVTCSSMGQSCFVPSASGGCARDSISWDEFLQREKGTGYTRVGISYNSYDKEMKIYYAKDNQ